MNFCDIIPQSGKSSSVLQAYLCSFVHSNGVPERFLGSIVKNLSKWPLWVWRKTYWYWKPKSAVVDNWITLVVEPNLIFSTLKQICFTLSLCQLHKQLLPFPVSNEMLFVAQENNVVWRNTKDFNSCCAKQFRSPIAMDGKIVVEHVLTGETQIHYDKFRKWPE